jgi:site-specific DNA recombinase
MKAIAYARVSTLTQKGNETIERQIAELRDYAREQSIELESLITDDGVSGADQSRAVQLVKEVVSRKDHVEALLVTSLDRLARDLYLQLFIEKELKKLGIAILSIHQSALTGDDPFVKAMRQIVGTFAQLEKDLITARLKSGRRYKTVEKGVKASGNLPLGYRYEGHGSRRSRVVVEPAEARLVRRLFELFLRADSVQSAVATLNREGYRNRRNQPFTRHTARALLLNDFYIGRVTYAGTTARGSHDPLISPVTFGKVKARLARNRKRP